LINYLLNIIAYYINNPFIILENICLNVVNCYLNVNILLLESNYDY